MMPGALDLVRVDSRGHVGRCYFRFEIAGECAAAFLRIPNTRGARHRRRCHATESRIPSRI